MNGRRDAGSDGVNRKHRSASSPTRLSVEGGLCFTQSDGVSGALRGRDGEARPQQGTLIV